MPDSEQIGPSHGSLPAGLASLRLNSDSRTNGLEDLRQQRVSRDEDTVAGALAFALELYDEYDTEILDAVELESRVRERIDSSRPTMTSASVVPQGPPLTSFLGAVDDPDGQPVNVVVERGGCDVQMLSSGVHAVLGTDSFSTVRVDAGAALTGGSWAFEVQIYTSGIMQIGWVTEHTQYTFEDGVGDSKDSYAFDGKRVRKWNVASMPYGEQWTAGDVIGCCVAFEDDESPEPHEPGAGQRSGTVGFFRNGRFLGVAFRGLSLDLGLFPAVSLSHGEACEINLGHLKFQYEYEGYECIVRPRRGALELERTAKYVFDSLERLTIIGQAKHRSSPRSAAAVAAVHAEEYFGLDVEDDEERQAYLRSLREPSACDVLMRQAQEDGARALVKQANDVFRDEYLIDALFMESCRRMNGYDFSGMALYRFLDIVAKGIGDDLKMLGAVAKVACHHATRRIMGNIWSPSEDPEYCEAIACSFIWQGFMKNRDFARAWVSQKGWEEDFERFFFVRQPTNADMASLVPISSDDQGIQHVLNSLLYTEMAPGQSNAGLIGQVADINRFLDMTDDVHAILLEQLIDMDDPGSRPGDRVSTDSLHSDGGSDGETSGNVDPSDVDDFLEYFRQNQATVLPREEWLKTVLNVMAFDEDPQRGLPGVSSPPRLLRAFMTFVIRKNMEVNREVVPAGVSDRSVICSLLSFMVRASRRILRDVQLEGNSFEFPGQVFLRGIRSAVSGQSDNSADNLAVDARTGGNVSYLCKKSIVEACNVAQRGPIRVGDLGHEHAVDWAIPVEMRPRAVFLDATPDWSWWILDQCFIMFYLGGNQSIKKISTFMSTFEAASSSFKGLEERLEAAAGSEDRVGNDRELIEHSLKECENTMMMSLRMLMWNLNWLMPRWKQQTYCVIAAMMSRVLLAVQHDESSPIVSYVADFYVEGVTDMLLACRGRETTAFAFEGDCVKCFESFLELCVKYVTDPRIVSPRLQHAVLNSIWMALRDEDTSYFISRSEYARDHLFGALVSQFAHSRNWIHAANAFHLLVQYNGLAPRLEKEEDTRALVSNRLAIQRNLKHALRTDDELAANLFSALIDRLNWVSPELISIVEELHQQVKTWTSRGGRDRLDGPGRDGLSDNASMNYRRALAACDLTYHLLRLLELACQANPRAVLDARTTDSQLLTTRLAEMVGWALRNFGKQSRAYHLAGEVHILALAGGMYLGFDIRPSMIGELQGPYMGILVALCHAADAEGANAGFDAFIDQVYELGVTDELIQECVDVVMDENLSGLEPMRPDELSSIQRCARHLKDRAERAVATVAEPPDDFLDPILNVLMSDPVILPSGVRLDRKTIQRHLANSATDPYTQQQLKEEDLVDDVELKRRVRDWLDAIAGPVTKSDTRGNLN